MRPFCCGTTMSSTPIETPARVAYAKPVYMSWSANTTASFKPTVR
jgi:hypothetical protein